MQTSLIAGTLFQSTHLALTLWFLAIYLISEAKTGLSALALKRPLGVSYPTAWLIQHKLMQAMTERDAQYTLGGEVRVDDTYLGGERVGGKAGRGSENKGPVCRGGFPECRGASALHQNDPHAGIHRCGPDRLGQSRPGPGQPGPFRWVRLLYRGDGRRVLPPGHDHRPAQTQPSAGVRLAQHDPG